MSPATAGVRTVEWKNTQSSSAWKVKLHCYGQGTCCRIWYTSDNLLIFRSRSVHQKARKTHITMLFFPRSLHPSC